MSEPIKVRASSAGRFVRCPGSVTLPQAQSDSGPARLGTAVHELCAAIVGDARKLEISTVAARYDVDAGELGKLVWSANLLWEENKAWFTNPQVEAEMKTELTGLTLTGHADVVSVINYGTAVIVGDWKSGWRDDDHSAQLKTYALLALETIADSDEIEKAYVSVFWLRDRSTETVEFSRAELLAWRDSLTEAAEKTLPQPLPQEGSFSVGDHCRYCPAIGCPLMQAQAMALGEPAALAIDSTNAAQLYAVANALEKRCDEVKRAVQQFIGTNGPVDAEDGKRLALVESTRETILLTEDSAAVLTGLVPLPSLYAACTVSKTKLADVVKAGAPRGQKGEAVDSMMDALRECGAVNETHSTGLKMVRS